MGLENRDYYRDGSYTDRLTGWGLDFTPVVKFLILANVAVFLLQIFFTRPAPLELPEPIKTELERRKAEIEKARARWKASPPTEKGKEKTEPDWEKQLDDIEERFSQLPDTRVSVVQEWLELSPQKTVYEGQVWRLLTCAFCHDRLGIWHIVFNMILLYWFGTRLENMYGSREFLLFYLVSALAGSVAFVALALYTGSNTPAIGASGAVMGVMMLYAIYYPFETILLFWILPVPIWAMLAGYVLFDLHPVLLALAGDRMHTGIAHAGHLGGLAFGYLYWRLGLRLEAPFDREGRPPLRRPVRKAKPEEEPAILAHPKRDPLNAQMDDVLRKISEQGIESLTDEERAILQKASAKLRGER
jgi:membrane associated rhomboid family serine protease